MIEHAESAEPSLPGNPYEVSRRDLLAAGTALGAAAAFGGTTRASAVTIISDRSYEAYNDPTKPLKNPERGIYASVQPNTTPSSSNTLNCEINAQTNWCGWARTIQKLLRNSESTQHF